MFCEMTKADIDFPVNFDLKIIVTREEGKDNYTEELEAVLNNIGVSCSNWRDKPSSKGTYISYTVNVNVSSRETFDLMYAKFREVDYIKTVI